MWRRKGPKVKTPKPIKAAFVIKGAESGGRLTSLPDLMPGATKAERQAVVAEALRKLT